MLYRRYQAVPDYLVDTIRLKRCGRKPKAITEYEETEIMKATKNEYPDMGAGAIEKILKGRGVRISHNRIHRYLKSITSQTPNLGKGEGGNMYDTRRKGVIFSGIPIGTRLILAN
ncbi:hypothetical protein M1394_00535 [Candidatus Marsarchaeota archaeon]|nr:hypothetical protein [Candidatus Marsarchaeota archaeon]